MKKAVKILIKGTVQGVFFRNFIKENADKLRLYGFVRNLSSNKVEIFAEGDIDNVDKLFEICKLGPKHAIIKEVKIDEQPFQDFKEFKVLRI
ncbi:MAG: acylphosphatase [Nanoarchaeota archaeon]|nr:acylphosphatase [Nanoarchaeota archaeon]